CLDHVRRLRIERRRSELVDPVVEGPPLRAEDAAGRDPEAAVILRDDVRFAVVVALQRLPSRQRATLILHDVFDRSLAEVAATLDTNPNAAKALLARARARLARARQHTDVDVPVDRTVVERLAQ